MAGVSGGTGVSGDGERRGRRRVEGQRFDRHCPGLVNFRPKSTSSAVRDTSTQRQQVYFLNARDPLAGAYSLYCGPFQGLPQTTGSVGGPDFRSPAAAAIKSYRLWTIHADDQVHPVCYRSVRRVVRFELSSEIL